MNMEPIGQKTALTSSEEGIFTTDVDVESGDKETEKIFDSTLDQILTEETDYENVLDELLEKGGHDTLISFVHQNQFDSEIVAEEDTVGLADYTLSGNEVMNSDMSTEDSRHVQSIFFQKTTPIAEEIIELADPRIVTEENNFVNLEESGVASGQSGIITTKQAYHEGQGGFNRKTYRSKKWLIKVARKVQGQSKKYQSQLSGCEKSLKKKRGIFGLFG